MNFPCLKEIRTIPKEMINTCYRRVSTDFYFDMDNKAESNPENQENQLEFFLIKIIFIGRILMLLRGYSKRRSPFLGHFIDIGKGHHKYISKVRFLKDVQGRI